MCMRMCRAPSRSVSRRRTRVGCALVAPASTDGRPPIGVLLLPRELERFILREQAEDLLRAQHVVAVDPPRVPYGAIARLPESLGNGLASRQARRLVRNLRRNLGEGPFDILTITGLIVNGEVHAHVAFSNTESAFGGHIEEGCRVLTFAVIVMAEADNVDFTGWDKRGPLGG